MGDVTQLLERWNDGDAAAMQELLALVYGELRRMADGFLRHERDGHTLQPTALVNELYLRFAVLRDMRIDSRRHFYGAAASAMRRILVDHSRQHRAQKRGGPDAVRVELDSLAVPTAPSDLDLRATGSRADRPERLRAGQGTRRRTAVLRRPVDRRDRGGPREFTSHRQTALGLRPGLALPRTQRLARRTRRSETVMSGTNWEVVERLFQAAIDLPAGERAAFLDDRCAAVPDVRTQVASLLAAHDASTDFLTPLGATEDVPTFAAGPHEGSRIGAYRLVREIGRGGMGTVYLARRADEAFEHDVAIKITRSAVSDPDEARRFQRERQMLAALHHPHIVTLLDGGTTPSGHAYLVMEYVDGSRITDWIRERGASLEERLRLFRQVCSAVHAAHQQGIVHRDLKPANILVTAGGVPKVLDFGIARLLSPEAGGVTQTGWGQGPLTPDYASPEQLRGLPASVTGDVYSLGVLLFEILAATRPYETTGKTVDQLLDQVLRGPTRKVSAAAATAGVPFAPASLRGDLDAIVQKAMQVDSADRYASAEDLSDDVARFLGGKPIVAHEPSLGYVLRKLAAQHRGVVVAAVLGVLGITAALGVALWQRQQAIEQRARAEARFNDVRQLANALIFKVHDAVAVLPGSTEARRLIATEALGYLDTLAASGGDDGLRLELAKGYKQVARALGDPHHRQPGRSQGRRHQPRASDRPSSSRCSSRRCGVRRAWSGCMPSASWPASSSRAGTPRRGCGWRISPSSRPSRSRPGRRPMSRCVAPWRAPISTSRRRPHAEAATPHWDAAGRLFEALWREAPDDPARMRNVALVDKYYARLLIDRGRLEEGDHTLPPGTGTRRAPTGPAARRTADAVRCGHRPGQHGDGPVPDRSATRGLRLLPAQRRDAGAVARGRPARPISAPGTRASPDADCPLPCRRGRSGGGPPGRRSGARARWPRRSPGAGRQLPARSRPAGIPGGTTGARGRRPGACLRRTPASDASRGLAGRVEAVDRAGPVFFSDTATAVGACR